MTYHRVKKGESLSQIALVYKIADWRTIYYHDLNAGLRRARRNPNVIWPGDLFFIPDAKPVCQWPVSVARSASTPSPKTLSKTLETWGGVFVGFGAPAAARIPIPGTEGLFVQLNPAGYVPKSGSTSTLFLQNGTGSRALRLDYGYNKTTGSIDFHWNQKGTFEQFKIPNHTPVGRVGKALYRGARAFKYAGRALLVIGVTMDVISIVVAKDRVRAVISVVSGWGGAYLGAKGVGAIGAGIGTLIEPGIGTAIGAFVGGIAGGIGGYLGFSWAAEKAYDYVREVYFEPLPETSLP